MNPLTTKNTHEMLRPPGTRSKSNLTIGGIFSAVALLLIAPPLARVALQFGPPEYFLVAVFGLSVIISVSSDAYLKGLISGVFGLLIATVGMDEFNGHARFIFDIDALLDGIPILPALIGLFSLSQAIKIAAGSGSSLLEGDVTFSDRVLPTAADMSRTWKIMMRSSVIGTIIGIR